MAVNLAVAGGHITKTNTWGLRKKKKSPIKPPLLLFFHMSQCNKANFYVLNSAWTRGLFHFLQSCHTSGNAGFKMLPNEEFKGKRETEQEQPLSSPRNNCKLFIRFRRKNKENKEDLSIMMGMPVFLPSVPPIKSGLFHHSRCAVIKPWCLSFEKPIYSRGLHTADTSLRLPIIAPAKALTN